MNLRFAFSWSWILGSPLLLASCAAAVLGLFVVGRALQAVQVAERLRTDLRSEVMRLAAEHAAAAAATDDPRGILLDAGGGIRAVANARRHGSTIDLDARSGELLVRYSCAALDGGALPSFGRALLAADDLALPAGWPEPLRVPRPELPRLRAAVPTSSVGAPREQLLTRDRGLALLRLPAGTDAEDYVLGRLPVAERGRSLGGLIRVDGNLWIDRGAAPLELDLGGDLTIAVAGNVYLGRSLRLVGPGRLCFVTFAPPGPPPHEGAGHVFVGLPGEPPTDRIECDAGLVVGGLLHLAVDRLRTEGVLVLGDGVRIAPGRRGELDLRGFEAPDLARSAVPGFPVVGGPRPGRLQVRDDALYLAAPTR